MHCAPLPVVGARLLSPFGDPRQRGQHGGIDLKAPEGSAVYAVAPGVVRAVASNGELERYGVTVVVDHGPWLTLSAHLRSAFVTVGEEVRAGQQLGTVGRTAGTAADPDAHFTRERAHLHLEFLSTWPVHQGGAGRLDPAPLFAELGIVVPNSGPIFSACTGPDKAIRRRTALAGGGALLVLLAALAAHNRGWW